MSSSSSNMSPKKCKCCLPFLKKKKKTIKKGKGKKKAKSKKKTAKKKTLKNKNKIVPVSKQEFEKLEEQCQICFGKMPKKKTKRYTCNHQEFCNKCINKWKKKNDTCPLCRAKSIEKKELENYGSKYEEDSDGRQVRRSRRRGSRSTRIVPI
jgi:hypothetical protein